MRDFPVVHAVTDSGTVTQPGFIERARAIMRALGPRGAVHLRSSRASGRKFHELASRLASFQQETGCWLIVNDRVDVAAAVGARGIQLASHSLGIADALAVAPEIPVGASIHSIDEALAAEAAGAAWCVAGTVFETPSHAGREPARIEFVAAVTRAVRIPVIAIGGVQPEDVGELLRAGAHGVATIRGSGWGRSFESSVEGDGPMKTRLPLPSDAPFIEPVTRYISAYDSESGSAGIDNPDSKRGTPAARQE